MYAPFTSVATNREFQVLYRAPLEEATDASAWEVVQVGSLSHWEGTAEGGIWGQTFSAFVDDRDDMRLMCVVNVLISALFCSHTLVFDCAFA